MSVISIDNIKLMNFDKNSEEHIKLYNDLVNGNSKSKMIHQIDERLNMSREVENLEFSNAYVMYFFNKVVGYLYLTGKKTNIIYIEMSILKDFRGKHIGSYLLDTITNYIFEHNSDLKEIKVSIDVSNYASMKMVQNAGFDYGEDVDYQNDKIDFTRENPYYIKSKR